MGDNIFLKKEELNFPVSYVLKAIFDNMESKENHIRNLKFLFQKLGITYNEFSSKMSSNKKYISFSVGIKVDTREIFDKLYIELRKLPHIKYAL